MNYKEKAYQILKAWKGSDYAFGLDCLSRIGVLCSKYGGKALVVANRGHIGNVVDSVLNSLTAAGVEVITGNSIKGAKNNSPLDDLYRVTANILTYNPDFVIAIGGGSNIDVVKAAIVVSTLGKEVSVDIDPFFGTNKVSEALLRTGRKLIPLIAIETVASSGSHLTKYSNITDMSTGQKKLIVDNAIVPAFSIFDYSVTKTLPISVTIEGILDSFSHSYEVFCGARSESYEKIREIFTVCVNLLFEYSAKLVNDPSDMDAREAIGLASDLGGYSIMLGGTSGSHLTSFSLVDCMPHGIACGVMNPYYTVFYEKAIQPQLKYFASILHDYGFMDDLYSELSGRTLAEAVANGIQNFNRSIGAPVRLSDISSFNPEIHIPRAIEAAKDDDLKMKLQNMPVPMTKNDVDIYMLPILKAAATGDFSMIKTM